jgi:HEPN domain-containing protein/predicted nucleotidyltransferase
MQTSLPIKSRQHQRIIDDICQSILSKHQDKIAFIILFGSFARGDWVYDTYMEDHITYEYASDYDFLILTKKAKQGSGYQAIRLENAIGKSLNRFKRSYKSHTPTIIIESLTRMNQALEKGQYFFSDIKKEGILLYDSGEFELAEPRQLTKAEISQIAKDDYEHWFNRGCGFLKNTRFSISDRELNIAAFLLHQATESLLNCYLLVTTGYKPKTHDLEKLISLCASQNSDFLAIFPLANTEQQQNFELLKNAYVDARYSKDYQISEQQLNYLIERVAKLQALTKSLCQQHIDCLQK